MGSRLLADVDQVLDEHAEGRPPVADVVLPDHGVAGEGQHPAQGVADDGGAENAGVHLLGHVGRGVVHDDRQRIRDRVHPKPRIGPDGLDLVGDEPVVEREVDESLRSHLHASAQAAELGGAGDLGGHLRRRRPNALAQGQGAIGLKVDTGSVRGSQHRVGPRLKGVERPLEALAENVVQGGHASMVARGEGERETHSFCTPHGRDPPAARYRAGPSWPTARHRPSASTRWTSIE